MDTVLITGANGFVGLSMVKAVVDQGHHVIAYVRDARELNQLKQTLGKKLTIIEVENLAEDTLYDALNENNVDTIIHTAGQSSARQAKNESSMIENIDTPTYQINAVGTASVAKAVVKYAEEKQLNVNLHYVNTGAVFSSAATPVNEETEKLPFNHYGWSKLRGEELLLSECSTSSFVSTSISYPPVIFGEGQKEGFVPNIIQEALKGNTLTYEGDGTSIKNMLHIHDYVKAVMKILNGPKQENNTFCFGGYRVSDADLFSSIATIAKKHRMNQSGNIIINAGTGALPSWPDVDESKVQALMGGDNKAHESFADAMGETILALKNSLKQSEAKGF